VGIDRRSVLTALAAGAAAIFPNGASAAPHTKHAAARPKPNKEITFDAWVATFRAKAQAHGITEATYTRVMTGLKPDMTGLKEIRNQPEFREQLWQYLNRRVSDWRIVTGRKVAKDYAPLLARIEKDYGVSPAIMLGVWGVESTFGDPLVE
jgi:membrane-bound lytic murein transglycosylase B